ncbi:MAG: hypothetical protein ABIR35_07105 [Polaromonas sp.]
MTIHNAPPVVYPLGRSSFLGGMLLALWLCGLTLAVLWLYAAQRLDWRVGTAFATVLSAGVAARSGWATLPMGQLAWDGKAWRWESAGYQAGVAEYEISVIADFQSRMLLRLENPARASLWLWLERSAFPERWLDLRRAIYSTRRALPVAHEHDLLAPGGAASEALPLADGMRSNS